MNARVLLVEDDRNLREALVDEGYRVRTAAAVGRALSMLDVV